MVSVFRRCGVAGMCHVGLEGLGVGIKFLLVGWEMWPWST